jgi:hypothetical protein
MLTTWPASERRAATASKGWRCLPTSAERQATVLLDPTPPEVCGGVRYRATRRRRILISPLSPDKGGILLTPPFPPTFAGVDRKWQMNLSQGSAERRSARSAGIPAAAYSHLRRLRRTDPSTPNRCTYILVRGAFRAPRPLHPRAAPPALLGGVAGTQGHAGGCGRGENAATGIPVTAFLVRLWCRESPTPKRGPHAS